MRPFQQVQAAMRSQLATLDQIEKAIEPSRVMTERLKSKQEAIRPPIDYGASTEWAIRRDTTPLQMLRVIEAMLAELQAGAERELAGAEREQEMIRLARRSVWEARIIGIGVGAAGVISGLLIALLLG